MPTWLTNGLTVLAIGMGTVLVTLFLLQQVIGVFGRVAARLDGRLVRPPAARPVAVTVSPATIPEDAAAATGTARDLAAHDPATHDQGAEGAMPVVAPREDRREAARLAAIAAAITAYLEAEATSRAGAVEPFRVTAVRSLGMATSGPACPVAPGLGWAQAGRLETMLARQQFGTRKGHSPR